MLHLIKKISFSLYIAVLLTCSAYGNAAEIKPSAPDIYIVKKGDTLWSIASMYLDQPWNWPVLWQNNDEIQNPHLIYPGDRILLSRLADGKPQLSIVRANKIVKKLSPKTRITAKQDAPLPTLQWSEIVPHFQYDLMLDEERYQQLPYLLGNQHGEVRFSTGDMVLGKHNLNSDAPHYIVRKVGEVLNSEGDSLGLLVKQIAMAEASTVTLPEQMLVSVSVSRSEAKRGDRLLQQNSLPQKQNLELVAATTQRGQIVGSLQDRAMLGKYDIAIIDLSEIEVSSGTVLGIYSQGPDIIDDEPIRYVKSGDGGSTFIFDDNNIEQPALKVGEMLVIKTFAKASFALIVSSTDVIRKGAFVGKP
ncbi:MAG: LysM peptidoglycan-binding domain-containing protein [Aestuariibacter sp.]